jgi:excisionase family DNA binding protein
MSRQINPTEKLGSRGEVAALVGCHPRTIQRAEKRGELHPIKFNARLIRYKLSEVLEWIENSRVQ